MSSVDVVVPCYNYARYLRGCVESVLSQRDVDVRVLIIDDKSTDDTPAVGHALAAADPRVSYRRHEVNKGLIGTANEGIEWVEAPYWLLLSADDALTSGSLSRATRIFDAHPDVGIAYGISYILKGESAPPAIADPGTFTSQIISGRRFIHRSCMYENPIAAGAVVRSSMQRQVGGYSANLPHTSDMEMWMRFAALGSVGVIREPQAFYRMHASNMSAAYMKGVLSDRRVRIATCEYAFRRIGDEAIEGFSGWLDAMKEKFAREALWIAGLCVEAGDEQGYADGVAFVNEFQPELRRSLAWQRLNLKRMLGPSATRALRFVSGNLRSSVAEVPLHLRSECAWWPEPEMVDALAR